MSNDATVIAELVRLCDPRGEYTDKVRTRVREIGQSLLRSGGESEMTAIHQAVGSQGSRMHARILEGYLKEQVVSVEAGHRRHGWGPDQGLSFVNMDSR